MSFQYLYNESNFNLEITGVMGVPEGDIIIPEFIDDMPVKKICDHAFSMCSGITSVTIPDSVEEIEAYAFEKCTSIKKINIPDMAVVISEGLFSGCSSLKQVNIGPDITVIEDDVFTGCSSLEKITVDEGNYYYSSRDGVLYDKDFSTLICYPAGRKEGGFDTPKNLLTIYRNAFRGCRNISSVAMHDGLQDIGECAFADCDNLKSVMIPESVMWMYEHCLGYRVNGEDFEKYDNFIIYCYENSSAEEYASGNEIKYRTVSEVSFCVVNDDSNALVKNLTVEKLLNGQL